jgi:ribosome maturation factor RimP
VSSLPPTDSPRPDDAPAPAGDVRPDAESGEAAAAPRAAVTLEDRIRRLADESAVDSGLFVVGVVVRGRPGNRVVEVFADGGPEGPAGIDELAGLSRRLAFLLDTEDPVQGAYRLDVSTPGADRPLVDIRQYPQHVGRTLRVSYTTDAGDAEATGTLTEATPEAVTLQPAPAKKGGAAPEPVVVPVAALREARVVLPW